MATWVPYDNAKVRMWDGNAFDFYNWTTLKVALVTSAYTPSRATHDFWDDVSANEVSGSNYTSKGIALTSRTLTVAGNLLTFGAADITWSQHATGFSNARTAIFFNDTGTAGTSALIAYGDLTVDRGNVSGDLTFQFPLGVLKC